MKLNHLYGAILIFCLLSFPKAAEAGGPTYTKCVYTHNYVGNDPEMTSHAVNGVFHVRHVAPGKNCPLPPEEIIHPKKMVDGRIVNTQLPHTFNYSHSQGNTVIYRGNTDKKEECLIDAAGKLVYGENVKFE
ncbi:hypothetical protein [Aliikangiella coralliicola]|uniref:Uncharacterized protein n=1 Tax=Aliikangiella coralliicola TaxID=2592383 RepID=A0A545UEM9_9GAMM|nr:hypothetical protein [Aliikangiella coralliicola]TQV87931.1 hypothetical protein FLL46_11170 [Aliikangiella coralliicola]